MHPLSGCYLEALIKKHSKRHPFITYTWVIPFLTQHFVIQLEEMRVCSIKLVQAVIRV